MTTQTVNLQLTKTLEGSIQIQYLSMHLSKFLDEFEAEFDRVECVSVEIAKDYINAANYMAKEFGRVNNRIKQVEAYLVDPTSLNF